MQCTMHILPHCTACIWMWCIQVFNLCSTVSIDIHAQHCTNVYRYIAVPISSYPSTADEARHWSKCILHRPGKSKIALVRLTSTCTRVRTLVCKQKLGGLGEFSPWKFFEFHDVRLALKILRPRPAFCRFQYRNVLFACRESLGTRLL